MKQIAPQFHARRLMTRAELARAERDARAAHAWRTDAKRDEETTSDALAGRVLAFDVGARTAELFVPTAEPLDLSNFTRNPVVVWGADTKAPPIGTCDDVEPVDGGVRFVVRFASDEASPLGSRVLAGLAEGVISRESVLAGVDWSAADVPKLVALAIVNVPPQAKEDESEETDEQRMRRLGITRRVNLNDPNGVTEPTRDGAQAEKEAASLKAMLAEEPKPRRLDDEERPTFDATTDPIGVAKAKRDAWARDAWKP